MEELIIKKKDIENIGKKIMKEVYEYFNDGKDICTFINKNNIEEIRKEKDEIKKILLNFTLMILLKIILK